METKGFSEVLSGPHQKWAIGTSLMIQWLRRRASSAGDPGSVFGWETKIPPAIWRSQKKTKQHPQWP